MCAGDDQVFTNQYPHSLEHMGNAIPIDHVRFYHSYQTLGIARLALRLL